MIFCFKYFGKIALDPSLAFPNSKTEKWSESDTYGKSESCAKQKCGQITGEVTVNLMHMVTLGGTIQGV